MPYAPIIPLIMRRGLGPCTTLAHFSEVTQGESGGGAEIDFICFLSSLAFQLGEVPPPQFLMSLPKSTTTPTVRHLLSSPRHPYILREKPQTSFLLRRFVFPMPAHVQFPFSAFGPTEGLRATRPARVFLPRNLFLVYSLRPCPPVSRHRLPLVCCWLTVRCCQASTSGAA